MVKHERPDIEITMKTKERLLEQYGWIADLYMIDFFVDDHWTRLPSSWRNCFDNFDAISWFNVLNNTNSGNLNIKDIDSSNNDSKHILPLSFICFKRLIDTVSLERKPVNGLKQLAELLEIDAQYVRYIDNLSFCLLIE
ncbi:unnamed protein product [Anisakis simplex]|uniref:Uncharacterized protein n=1 Tax=Anisakis simplex TaxID=6269 RepID=A0A0M3KIR4_ANISI|nr:unnamed protein product [Anisakis simplex]